MTMYLKILLVCILPLHTFAWPIGPGSSGGGAPAPEACRQVSESLPLGHYESVVESGWPGAGKVLITPQLIKVQLSQRGNQQVVFGLEGLTTRLGIVRGEAALPGRKCLFEVELVRVSCAKDNSLQLRLAYPFWLGDYLFQPEKYNYDCQNAINHPSNAGNAPTYSYFQ